MHEAIDKNDRSLLKKATDKVHAMETFVNAERTAEPLYVTIHPAAARSIIGDFTHAWRKAQTGQQRPSSK